MLILRREILCYDFVLDAVDSEHVDYLAVSHAYLGVAMASSADERYYFFSLRFFLYCCKDLGFRYEWASDCCVFSCSNHEHFIYAHLLADFKIDFFDHYSIILHDFVLSVSHSKNSENLLRVCW